MNNTYAHGLFVDVRRCELRPIRHLGTDLRDFHLLARWARLCRRWVRR